MCLLLSNEDVMDRWPTLTEFIAIYKEKYIDPTYECVHKILIFKQLPSDVCVVSGGVGVTYGVSALDKQLFQAYCTIFLILESEDDLWALHYGD